MVLLSLGGRRRGAVVQADIDRPEAHDLAGFEDGLLDGLAVDECAVGRVEVPNHHLMAAHKNLAMVARDGWLGDLKGVVLHPPDSGPFPFQLERGAREPFCEDDKLGHRSECLDRLFRQGDPSQTVSVRASIVTIVGK